MLESRHVIGLFLLMLVFSGVFFTLGYVMGRNQYDGQVRAEAVSPRPKPQPVLPAKSESAGKHTANAADSSPPSDIATQPNSEWSFYNAGKQAAPDENLRSVASSSNSRTVPAAVKGRGTKSSGAQISPSGYTLQVAALRKASDALNLASHLQRKNFPAFVVSPQADKYYRVQVGPYPDQKSAEAARRGLEGAGFKAIVKH